MPELIQTKLNRPVTSHDIIARPELFSLLDVSHAAPLTLISAPAGYGKSTLVSAWLQQREFLYGWLSLDEEDNHLLLVASYLIAAIQTQNPHIGANTTAMLRAPLQPSESTLTRTLINDLNAIEQDCWLVLDDYHLIHDATVHRLIAALLRYPPPKLHLILLTREEPPLPLSPLRGSGQLLEIGADHLRFSEDEAGAFLTTLLGYLPDGHTALQMIQKIEGWPIGLSLLAYSLRQQIDISGTLANGRSLDLQYIIDYFSQEVFAHVAVQTRTFLMATSLLENVCSALAQTLLPEADIGGHLLVRLWKSNLFVVPVDTQGEWYRYHDLFRQFLRQEAKKQFVPSEIQHMQRVAARWYEDRGMLDEAFHHVLLLDDLNDAVQFVIRHRHRLLDREQWSKLEIWLEHLPPDQVRQQPALLITQALIASNRGRFKAVEQLLNHAESLLARAPEAWDIESLRGEIDLLRGALITWSGDGAVMVELSQRALDRLPEGQSFVRVAAHTILAAGWRFLGRHQYANDYLYHLYENESTRGNISQATLLLFVICVLLWQDSELYLLQIRAQALLALGKQHQRSESVAAAHYFLGCAAYNQNNLADAIDHLQQAIAVPYLLQTLYYVHGVCALAHAYQRTGRPDDALGVISAASRVVLEMQVGELTLLLDACRIEIGLWRSIQAEAENWFQQTRLSMQPFNRGFYDPLYTRLKIALLRGSPSDLAQAEAILAQFDQAMGGKSLNRRNQIQSLLYRAWLANQLGDRAAALSMLREALRLAEPGGCIRPIADLVPVLGDLLQELHNHGVAVSFIDVILDASAHTLLAPLAHVPLEPLSEREMDVLLLLADDLTNDEISQRLFIAVGTVKQHTHRIYRKLRVSNRDQAVRLARSLKLLS